MSAPAIALLFGAATLVVAWRIWIGLVTGVAGDRGYRYDINVNPLGYLLAMIAKAVFVAFGTAEVLHAFGLAADPVLAIQNLLPAFLAHPRR